tara:strand:- start:409 stop:615 length:207 start_codon:yes stop_codon:yes gene_type:complete
VGLINKEGVALAKNIITKFTAKANLKYFNIHGLKHRGNRGKINLKISEDSEWIDGILKRVKKNNLVCF